MASVKVELQNINKRLYEYFGELLPTVFIEARERTGIADVDALCKSLIQYLQDKEYAGLLKGD